MRAKKRVIAKLDKCYSLSDVYFQGKHRFLVATEKAGPCLLFEEDGTQSGTVWTGPGGVMTMAQVPGADGQFLAIQRFYSPNDSKEARIVVAAPGAGEEWKVRTLCDLPFVHRFGILQRNGVDYLIACCLKTDHKHKDDWSAPGACYGAILPKDLSPYEREQQQLPLRPLKEGMLKNHGYSILRQDGYDTAVIGCEQGTFLFTPPEEPEGEWEIQHICAIPSSDSVLIDLDGDGELELGCISPFHGASLTIYHLDGNGNYYPCWKYAHPEAETEMIHATWAGTVLGKATWLVGWRKGSQRTIAITYQDGDYRTELIDADAGCANVLHFVDREGNDVVIGANREKDEVVLYTLTGS